MIKYDKLMRLFEERGITTYILKRDKILGQATFQAIKNGRGGLDHRSIDRICRSLNVQPGDIMEFVPDEEEITTTNKDEQVEKETGEEE